MGKSKDRLFGTLNLLVLRALAVGGRLHGYDITERIKVASGDVLLVEEGSLYPALHRMEEAGWLTSHWDVSLNNRRARFYQITPRGRQQLRALESEWTRHVDAVARMLRPA
jgi:PadR family transcriptional regulator PadR